MITKLRLNVLAAWINRHLGLDREGLNCRKAPTFNFP